jgi:hypothetical protein
MNRKRLHMVFVVVVLLGFLFLAFCDVLDALR